MRRVSLTVVVLAAIVFTANVTTQTPPSFAGKWTQVPDASAPGGGGRGFGGLGQSATIVQDDATLTITRSTQAGEFTTTYKLDGSESKNTLNFQGNPIEQLSKAKWDGAKLIVNTSMNFGGNPVDVSMTMVLDPSGSLIVETTRPDFQGGGAPITTKSTYKKT